MDNKVVDNGRWCVPTSLVHLLVAEYHDALPSTTSGVEKNWKEIVHGVKDEELYKAVEPHVPFTRMTPSASKGT